MRIGRNIRLLVIAGVFMLCNWSAFCLGQYSSFYRATEWEISIASGDADVMRRFLAVGQDRGSSEAYAAIAEFEKFKRAYAGSASEMLKRVTISDLILHPIDVIAVLNARPDPKNFYPPGLSK